MKVRKLGLDWGPAYQEACPVRLEHAGIEVIAFVTESGALAVRLPTEANISWSKDGFVVLIPTE